MGEGQWRLRSRLTTLQPGTSHPGRVSQEGIRRAAKRQRTLRPKGPYPRFLITPSCTVEATSTPSCV